MIDPDALKSIEDLHRLKTEGVITEDEFDRAKERLLFGGKLPKAAAAQSSIRQGPNMSFEDHVAWAVLPLRRYADFKGRSSQREYWMFMLIHLGLYLTYSTIVSYAAARDYSGDLAGWGGIAFLATLLALVAAGALVVPTIAVQVRRFHDQDRSGLLALLNLIPIFGGIAVLVMMILPGTEGSNQYGPDPLQS